MTKLHLFCLSILPLFKPTLAFTTFVGGSSSFSCRLQSLSLDSPPAITVDPKEAVKLFGRLAEKYIMLDPSGGLCCYSGCSDCEFRLPDGGYRMADQSASRPKWIPVYETRAFQSSGKSHFTKWSSEIFKDGPSVTKDIFVNLLCELEYSPPLGGPYLPASSAIIEDRSTAERLFDVLVSSGKEKLTKHRMSLRMKELAQGEEGLTWPNFIASFEL